MDKAKILRQCNEIERAVNELYVKEQYSITREERIALINMFGVIVAEITALPKTNADRIRQMTDEELADFFCRISECCGNDACMLCPIFEGCAQNVMCVERWLKQEVSEDAG